MNQNDINEIKKKIIPSVYYSIRQLVSFIPWVHNAPTMKKIINDDIKKNDNKMFETHIIKRGKQKRYFVKGEKIIKYLNSKIEKNVK